MRLPRSKWTLTPASAPTVGYSGAVFCVAGFGVLWRVLGMAFKSVKTQQLFGYALVLVGWIVIYYHPEPIAGVMLLPLMLVGGYHTWAGYLRHKRERSK